LKKFSWTEKISCMTKFIEKLEDKNIKYTIQTNAKFKYQNIFIGKANKQEIMTEEI